MSWPAKPVLVLQHVQSDGPAFLGEWLRREGIPYEVRNTQAGEEFPPDLRGHGALAILGGPMSANDPLPSLRRAEQLVREALLTGVPAIGHCLGGQLMARALGARVSASPVPEIGWQPIRVHDLPLARECFGGAGQRTVFQWHYDVFELPPGAQPLASSDACGLQAFALGSLLALQFHVEIDSDKLAAWSADGDEARLEALRHDTVQAPEAMRKDAALHLAAQQALAHRLYRRWLDR